MKPIRTFEVTVTGFPPLKYAARSIGKALARAYSDYTAATNAIGFANFMGISRARRVEDPPGCGERIVVAGETVTRVYDHRHVAGGPVYFMRDDSDAVLCSHPRDVSAPADLDKGRAEG